MGRRRAVACGSALVQDPADVIPDAVDSDNDEDASTWDPANTPALVVGAGPVGLMAAMYLARRGHPVQIIDRQQDPTATELLGMAPGQAAPVPDMPLVLSSRCLLAFEELGATELLQGLLAPLLLGTWRVHGAAWPGGPPSAPELEPHPGWSGRYTRRVLVQRSKLVQALLVEAERLYGSKIQLYWESEFVRVDWDERAAVVSTQPPPGQAKGGDGAAMQAPADPLLPELAGDGSRQEVRVPFALLVGADGADSAVRRALELKRPRVTDFTAQRPLRDARTFKCFDSLPQVLFSGKEAVPGMAQHGAREYEYCWQCPRGSAPSLRMWVPAQGFVCGMVESSDNRWEAQHMEESLVHAYGATLPHEWLQQIVAQTCGPSAPPASVHSSTVQCSQFHGPRTVLLGDAAHAMTTAHDQGVNCAVEGVRLLNIALKSVRGNLDKALVLFSEVRCEDVHSMQQLELFQRVGSRAANGLSTQSTLLYSDAVHRAAGLVAALVWQAARVTMQLATQCLPQRFPPTYVSDRLWDGRRGYSDLLKVVLRFAAVPILLSLATAVVAARATLLALVPRLPNAAFWS